MIAKKRTIKHQCYCRDCDLYWTSKDTDSKCPNCGKEIVAKICITRVEEEEENEENE